ncbi:Lrp/AsnC family transcriptional regulator [Sphingobium terrigena]|uniref:Lrp/AsnC family transcriptional regulator n=1 Tax=Sphingobium terrigena TaxID=2304063 RepID=UPI001C71A8AE|nr:Lrp/AsnC family transcriptional regulator [Sphingobium terrigena]
MTNKYTQLRPLDRADSEILKTLAKDGRISWRDLAERIGLSLTPTLRRVRQLEQEGIIKGYTAQIDQTRLIGSMAVFISITLERQVDEVLGAFETAVLALPEIMGGYLMSGGSDYMLHAFVRDLEHYRLLLGQLTRLEGIAHIQSSFVLKTFTQRIEPANSS